ncbi:MAG: PaaI family thioesterase [Gammaproteobacteria bacterium]|nr:PaaI family thioesterase [Gammaproteobacteria bacterium]
MAFTVSDGNALLGDVFAPWIQALALEVVGVSENGARLKLPFDDSLCRVGGILCGQSLMAVADTAAVIAICSASGAYREMATVDQSIHLMKPVAGQDVLADAEVTRLGRSMAFIQVSLSGLNDGKAVAMAQLAYAIQPAA